MLKQLLGIAAALVMSSVAVAQDPAIVAPTAILTPHLQDLHSTDIIINRRISTGSTPVDVTIKLDMLQDNKGKLVGTATFDSTEEVPGKPSVSLPLTITVKGKIKGDSFSIKGTSKIAGGADFHSRTVKLAGSFLMDLETFQGATLTSTEDSRSTVTYRGSFSVSGLGRDYNQGAVFVHRPKAYFAVQHAKDADTYNLKSLPANADYFEFVYPGGYDIAPGYVNIIGSDTVFSIKSRGVSATITEFGGNGLSPLYPHQFVFTSKTGNENMLWPYYNFVFFVLDVIK